MPKSRDIKVYLVAKSDTTTGIHTWLQEEFDYELPIGGVSTPADTIVGVAGKRCYKSFKLGDNPNLTKIRSDWAEYIDNILASGHGSVLEHVSFTFAIEGVSRVFTGEMNRHRARVAISEGSMRYIRYDDIPFCMPTSLLDKQGDDPRVLAKKAASRSIFKQAFFDAENHYKRLNDIWEDELEHGGFTIKKHLTSMFRRIIPMGVDTGGLWTFNIRALRHVLTMRCDPSAEEEIAHVCNMICEQMVEMEPHLFGDFQKLDTPDGTYYAPKYRKV